MESLPRIAITMGDPAGIGPEVIVKALSASPKFCRAVVIGDADCIKSAALKFAPGLNVNPIQRIKDARFAEGTLDILDLKNVPADLPSGQASAEGGKASVEYIRKAVELAMAQEVDGITTAPINKEGIHLAGFHYPGHTELLAELTDTSDFALMMAGKNLRVVLATTHVALSEVKKLITRDRVLKIIQTTHRWLSQYVRDNPKIAVTGLNPHCGDGGIFGEEETEAIIPAVEECKKNNMEVSGPFPADALFGRIKSSDYDAVIAMYHDQGMVPIKMESMGQAVNITLGLPIIRTSVDHGTAYDIAGKGLASPDSMVEALKSAAQFSKTALALK